MKHWISCLLSASCLLSWSLAAAQDGQKSSTEPKGYHWYQQTPPAAQKKEKTADKHPRPDMPSHSAMMAMHPQQIRALLDEHREYAIYTLQPADVLNYQKIQDVARRKAEGFAAVSSMVLMQTPSLSAQSAIPTTNPGVAAQRKLGSQAIAQTLATAKDNFALGFFTVTGCRYCQVQKQTLAQFRQRYGWKIQEYDTVTHEALAEKFNVELTPSLVIIKRNSTAWTPVSVGVESLSTIEQNVYRAIRLLNNDIKPQQFFMSDHEKGGFADPLAGAAP